MENTPDPQTQQNNENAPEQDPSQNSPEQNPQTQNSQEQPSGTKSKKQRIPRSEYVKKKKERFFKTVKIVGLSCLGLILLIVLITFLRSIYIKNKDKFVVVDNKGEGNQGVVVVTEEEENEKENWETYSNDTFRFSFNYPKEDKLVVEDPSDDEYIAKIVFAGIVPEKSPKGENMIKGYMFSVNPLALSKRNIDSVVSLKRDYFVEICPDTAEVSQIMDTWIDNLPGKKFEISNCNSDYIVSYVPENNYIYEIVQTFKGDLGYKQTYKSQTNIMLDSLIIYEQQVQVDPITKFENQQYHFSFEYPSNLDSQCCKVAEPPYERLINFITLSTGDPEKVVGFFS